MPSKFMGQAWDWGRPAAHFIKANHLIGDILSVEPSKIGVLALILLAVVLLWLASFNQLIRRSF